MTDFENATTDELGWKTPLHERFPYISFKDISLEQETVRGYDIASGEHVSYEKGWVAKFEGASYNHDGTFVSANGPRVEMTRSGYTSDEAYDALTEALKAEGWTLR